MATYSRHGEHASSKGTGGHPPRDATKHQPDIVNDEGLTGSIDELYAQHPFNYDSLGPHHDDDSECRHHPITPRTYGRKE
jgi:hypothetical protein